MNQSNDVAAFVVTWAILRPTPVPRRSPRGVTRPEATSTFAAADFPSPHTARDHLIRNCKAKRTCNSWPVYQSSRAQRFGTSRPCDPIGIRRFGSRLTAFFLSPPTPHCKSGKIKLAVAENRVIFFIVRFSKHWKNLYRRRFLVPARF